MTGRPHEDGELALREIGAAWAKTQQHWHDDMASSFGRLHWGPLVDESRSYLRSLGECMELLTAAERETEY
jgi:hypothetical protein